MNKEKCFNKACNNRKAEPRRRGWKLNGGGYTELCDRCASTFEEGRFCQTFHADQKGWVKCDSCNKSIHCGCIVSFDTYVLLDLGGVSCNSCDTRDIIVLPNQISSSPLSLLPLPPPPERPTGRNLVSRQWGLPFALWNTSALSESHLRVRSEVDINSSRYSVTGNTGVDLKTTYQGLHRDEHNVGGLQSSFARTGDKDFISRIQAGPTLQPSSSKDDQRNPLLGIGRTSSSANVAIGQNVTSKAPSQLQITQLPYGKQSNAKLESGSDASGETQVHNGRIRAESRGRSSYQPRYWPKLTTQELQQLSGDPNSIITPLFEKMLSASDAGKIGRLVLPKKCAEAYFPAVSQPEGMPIKILDVKGNEWVLQFRFWPNNNSRMYVLEGITPFIQSMQLQAGDIVTFSRLDPAGKLVIGVKKGINSQQTYQENPPKGINKSSSQYVEVNPDDPAPKEMPEGNGPVNSSKRRERNLSKGKRLRIENEDSTELNLTCQEAQSLIYPPPNTVPGVVVIDGFEIEEYKEAPVLGNPEVFATDQKGSSLSSAQEITTEKLTATVSKKMKVTKNERDIVRAPEGPLNTLVNLAILEDEMLPLAGLPTTKHPRHRVGCTCIVCVQPPSGQGPKHKDTCVCSFCLILKRRFHNMMVNREKRQSEKEAESARKKLELFQLAENSKQAANRSLTSNNGGSAQLATSNICKGDSHENILVIYSSDYHNEKKPPNSPCKGNIDLNIQPDRENELSPERDSGIMTSNGDLVVIQTQTDGARDVGCSGFDAAGKVINDISCYPACMKGPLPSLYQLPSN